MPSKVSICCEQRGRAWFRFGEVRDVRLPPSPLVNTGEVLDPTCFILDSIPLTRHRETAARILRFRLRRAHRRHENDSVRRRPT